MEQTLKLEQGRARIGYTHPCIDRSGIRCDKKRRKEGARGVVVVFVWIRRKSSFDDSMAPSVGPARDAALHISH